MDYTVGAVFFLLILAYVEYRRGKKIKVVHTYTPGHAPLTADIATEDAFQVRHVYFVTSRSNPEGDLHIGFFRHPDYHGIDVTRIYLGTL